MKRDDGAGKTAGGAAPGRYDLLLVFGIAAAVRAVYLWQYRSSPFFDFLHLDPRYYHDWAVSIAAGDWLGKEVFEQSPLYPYLLAVYFVVFGKGLLLLRVFQFAMGAVTAVLTAALGKRLFGRASGLSAGIGAAIYGPFLFYEGQVMKEFLTPLFSCVALLLLYRAIEKAAGAWRLLVASGATIGLAALVRDNFLLLLPVFAIFLVAGKRSVADGAAARSPLKRFGDAAVFAAGAFAILMPVLWRNHHVAGEWVLTTSGGGEVFYIGNGPHANGAYVPPPWVRANPRYEHEDFRRRARELTGRPLNRSEASGFWYGEGWKAISADPLRWGRLLFRKAALFLNDHELPDNYSYDSFIEFTPLLGLLPDFGWAAILAAPGFLASLPRWRELTPLYLAGGGYMASVMLFFNFARFRLPFLPVLLLFAGHGAIVLARLTLSLRAGTAAGSSAGAGAGGGGTGGARIGVVAGGGAAAGRKNTGAGAPSLGSLSGRKAVALYAGAALLAGFVTHVDLSPAVKEPFQDRLHLAAAYSAAGRIADAETVLRTTISEAESLLMRYGWKPGDDIVPGGVTIAWSLHSAHRDLAGLLLGQGRRDEAIAEMVTAIPFDPNDAELFEKLGGAHRESGDLTAAIRAYDRGIAVKPSSFTLRFDRATALYDSGDAPSALAELLRAREATGELASLDLADWHMGMGTVLHALPGREAEAMPHFREGLRLNPAHPQAAEVRSLPGFSGG